jgi:hypothetical protein
MEYCGFEPYFVIRCIDISDYQLASSLFDGALWFY